MVHYAKVMAIRTSVSVNSAQLAYTVNTIPVRTSRARIAVRASRMESSSSATVVMDFLENCAKWTIVPVTRASLVPRAPRMEPITAVHVLRVTPESRAKLHRA